jgi:hypothetical protein
VHPVLQNYKDMARYAEVVQGTVVRPPRKGWTLNFHGLHWRIVNQPNISAESTEKPAEAIRITSG